MTAQKAIHAEVPPVVPIRRTGMDHIPPMEGTACSTEGLWAGKFLKPATHQGVNQKNGRVVAPHATAIGDADMTFGHAVTCWLRFQTQSRAA